MVHPHFVNRQPGAILAGHLLHHQDGGKRRWRPAVATIASPARDCCIAHRQLTASPGSGYTGAERPEGACDESAEEAADEGDAQSEAALKLVLSGAIARVVFRNAVAAVPGNAGFRRKFLEALAAYTLPGEQCVNTE